MKKLVSLKNILVLLAVVLVFDACVPSQENFEEKNIPADRLIKKLEASRRKVKTFVGNGVLKVTSPDFEGTASFEVSLTKPDKIKLNVFGPFGIDLARASVTSNEFVFYDVMRNKVYKGTNGDGILRKIFKVDLNFNDLMDAFAGSVNLTDKLRQVPDKYAPAENTYNLTYIDEQANKISNFVIDSEKLTILNFDLTDMENKIVFEGSYSRFVENDGLFIPYNSIIKNDEKMQKVEIEYRNVEVNPVIENMEISYPRDADVVEWN